MTRDLREILRSKGLRYAQVAAAVGVSESSIKRILTARDGSVGRLTEICQAAGIGFAELVAWGADRAQPGWALTAAQEKFFLRDLDAFRFFEDLSLRKLTPTEAGRRRGWGAARRRRALLDLEGIGLLEVRGAGRPPAVVPRGALRFPPESPLLARLQRDLAARVVGGLFRPGGPAPGEVLVTREWMAGPETLRRFRRGLADCVERAEREATRDEAVAAREDLAPMSFFAGLVAYAPRGGAPESLRSAAAEDG